MEPKQVARKYSWSSMPIEEVNPTLSRRFLVGKDVMVAHVYLKAGSVVPKHHHVNEQITYVLEGVLRLWVGDKVDSEDAADAFDIAAGDVLVIPSNVPHRAVALEDTLDVDIFSPPREDWISGSDRYLREANITKPA
jgi:quercetin dioxygenase-like cupin family protein